MGRNTEKQAELITGMVVRQCEGGIASYSSVLFKSHTHIYIYICMTSSSVLFLLKTHNASKALHPSVIR